MPSGPGADSLQELRALANSSTEISCLIPTDNEDVWIEVSTEAV